MIHLRVLDILAGALWCVGAVLMLDGVAEDSWRIAAPSLLPIAGAATATAMGVVTRIMGPIRDAIKESAELTDAVTRLNGSRARSSERV